MGSTRHVRQLAGHQADRDSPRLSVTPYLNTGACADPTPNFHTHTHTNPPPRHHPTQTAHTHPCGERGKPSRLNHYEPS